MNVDKLRKMNSLAETLKKRGLVASRDDAAHLAGSLVGTPEEQEFTKLYAKSQEAAPAQATEAGAKMAERGMSEEQIRKVLQSFADQFVVEINKMGDKISQQEQRIVKFQELLVAMQHTPEVSVVHTAISHTPRAEPVEEEEKVAVVKAPSANPRSGSYQSSDVSIEKFFYCGNK